MAFLKIVALFLSILAVASGLAAPAQWNTYRTAVQNSGLNEISGDVSNLIDIPVYTIYFTFPQVSMTLNTSATANQIRSDIASLTTCTFLEWTSLGSLLKSTLTLRCGDWDDISPLLLSSSTVRTYGTDINHWCTQPMQRSNARQQSVLSSSNRPTASPTHHKRAAKREGPFPDGWEWPGYDPWAPIDSTILSAEHGFQMNEQIGFNTDPKDWHFSSATQNNPPLLYGNVRERRYPYLGRPGKFYIADSGVDAQHPEFAYIVNGNVSSRVINNYIPVKYSSLEVQNYWDPYHDQSGHGTAIASLAAGRLLGIAPNALIQNFKVYTDNAYDCVHAFGSLYGGGGGFNNSTRRKWCDAVHPNAFQRAVEYTIREAATLRQDNLGPAVFMSASVPRAEYNGTDLPMMAFQDKLTDSFKALIATGVMVVTSLSNEMYRIDNAEDLRVKLGHYAPWVWLPEMIIVGGIDRDYQQAVWTTSGYDDLWYAYECLTRLERTGGSSFGDAFDFYAPAYGFASLALTNRYYTYDNNWNNTQPYWRAPNSAGTSYAVGQVAAGVLAYLSTLDNPWTDTTPLETINTLKRSASNHTVRMFEMPTDWKIANVTLCGSANSCDPNAPDRPKAVQAIDNSMRLYNAYMSGKDPSNVCYFNVTDWPAWAQAMDAPLPLGDYAGWFDIQVLKLVPVTGLNATRFCSL